ncbi:MAG TPA: site-2 protease family protein [Candidatus Limnocylindrales bacterium]|nr:site-2 protease family protein [Candidatus Limnocylindrales bacterium]
MRRRVGSLFGIEIRLQGAWIVILALIAYLALTELGFADPPIDTGPLWLLSALVAVLFLASSIVHDVAHAVVARRRGMEVSSVSITFFGGANPLDPTPPRPIDDVYIALAGPAASLVLGAAFGAIAAGCDAIGGPVFEPLAETLAVVTALNLIVGLANIIPAYPLDGGRVARALGWWRGGTLDAGWRSAALIGRAVGIITIAIGVVMLASGPILNGGMTILAGWFLTLSSRSINERLRVNRLIGGLHVQDAMETSPVSVGPHLTVDTFAEQLLDEGSEMTAVPVVSDGDVVGILGARQLRRLQRRLWPTTRVEDVMAKPPRLPMLSALDSLDAAVERLYRTGLDGIPVVDGRTLVGILTRRSVGKLVHERGLDIGQGRTPA